ncbi:fasciculation and elongation protein zeta-2-like [Babylonia areolata]|uniref:fasciculation and elongation protein zeta-2-like n=1 Tax=Babylonia areolata TaxID=304850 RepID=UPI003FD02F2A
MAELQFEAPLAAFENEEWNEYHDFQSANLDNMNSNKDTSTEQTQQMTNNGTVAENFREACSGSLEDLVNSFDEKISNCFCNFEEQVEKIAPVQIRSQEEIMSDCQMWWTITGNFGNILPIDWSKTYARQLQNRVLHLQERQEREQPGLDLSDDEELAQAFDMHSLIVSSLHRDDDDPVETADDVIRQIENMMKDPSTEDDDSENLMIAEDEQYSELKAMLAKLPCYKEAELKDMTCAELHELLAEYEGSIKELSELLVTELALRDELDYDKELKNSFISLLLSIQKKRRDTNADRKKKQKNRPSDLPGGVPVVQATSPTSETGSTFLTTVIPYHPQQGPPTSEQLQIYNKILEAINEDSSTVPTLLTDYILKVLCPTH